MRTVSHGPDKRRSLSRGGARCLAFIALLLTALAVVASCRAARSVPVKVLAQGTISAVSPGRQSAVQTLAGRGRVLLFTAQSDWAPVRDVLNTAAGLGLYSHVDFGRYLLLAYFHGASEDPAHLVETASVTARGRRLVVELRRSQAQGAAADGTAYPYVLLAVAWSELAPADGRRVEVTVEARYEGRWRGYVTATGSAPAPSAERGAVWVRPTRLGSGRAWGWLPDGRALVSLASVPAGTAHRRLTAIRPDDPAAEPQVVLELDRGGLIAVRPGPDGRIGVLATEDDRRQLYLVDVNADRAARDITPAGWSLGEGFAWTADARTIVTTARGDAVPDHQILALDPGALAEPRTVYAQDGPIARPIATGDGWIYFRRQTGSGWVLSRTSLDGLHGADLVPADAHLVSPDGGRIAYVTAGGPLASLHLASPAELIAGAAPAALRRSAPGTVGARDWAPDGGALLYTAQSPDALGVSYADLYLLEPSTTGERRLTAGGAVGPAYLGPGGQNVLCEVYVGGQGGPELIVLRLKRAR